MKKYNVEFTREVVSIECIEASIEVEENLNEEEIIDEFYLAIQGEDYVILNREVVSADNIVEGSEEITNIKPEENE